MESTLNWNVHPMPFLETEDEAVEFYRNMLPHFLQEYIVEIDMWLVRRRPRQAAEMAKNRMFCLVRGCGANKKDHQAMTKLQKAVPETQCIALATARQKKDERKQTIPHYERADKLRKRQEWWEENRDQVWAEALHYYRQGVSSRMDEPVCSQCRNAKAERAGVTYTIEGTDKVKREEVLLCALCCEKMTTEAKEKGELLDVEVNEENNEGTWTEYEETLAQMDSAYMKKIFGNDAKWTQAQPIEKENVDD